MSALRQACARVLSLFRREALDAEFDSEARTHLELAVEDYLARGMSEPEARRLARIRFGALEASKDEHRDSRGFPWLDGILCDFRFALRSLRRDRAFTLTAIAMLTLAIALNVTVFAVVDTMLYRGYPLVKGNDRLVYIQEKSPRLDHIISYADFEDWRAQSHAFEGLAFVSGRQISLSRDGGHAVDTGAAPISANAFRLLRVSPLLGRDFTPADEAPGAPRVAILSYRFWTIRFGKRPDVVGLKVLIDKAPATIVGVMPKGFDFPVRENLWIPLGITPEMRQRQPSGFLAFGRLKDDATVAQARTELETVNRRLAAAYPATNRGVVPIVRTWSQFSVGPNGSVVYGSLWVAAWFILLIACANLANLTLARTIGRAREFSTRIALGAGQGRMVRQILIETFLLAAAGAIPAWWIAKWSVHAWDEATSYQYQILDYQLDNSTVAYLVAIAFAAALLCAIAPIARVLRFGANGALNSEARGVTQGRPARHLSSALVVAQMAMAIVLLSGAGILVRSLLNVVNAEVGVAAPERILIGRVSLPRDGYPSPQGRIAFFDNLRLKLLAIPGVETAAIASHVPAGNVGPTPFEPDAQPLSPIARPTLGIVSIGLGYFRTVGAATVAGRDFNASDLPSSLPVAIVNRRFTEKYWPGQDPLGKQLRIYLGTGPAIPRTIVGVASNIRQDNGLRQEFLPLAYVPFTQVPLATASFLARTTQPSALLASTIRTEVTKLDPDLTLEDFSTLKASFAFQPGRMDVEHMEMGRQATVAPVFAAMALLLAAIGLYAVIAYSVSQRTKEIGIRIAIGATAADIRRMILREGMLPVGVGLLLGLAVSLGVNRILQSQLVGVSPWDPLTLATAPAVLILVALLACRIPSGRAIRVEPTVALRHD